MKFSRTSFSLVFSLVAFLIAAGVLVLALLVGLARKKI